MICPVIVVIFSLVSTTVDEPEPVTDSTPLLDIVTEAFSRLTVLPNSILEASPIVIVILSSALLPFNVLSPPNIEPFSIVILPPVCS